MSSKDFTECNGFKTNKERLDKHDSNIAELFAKHNDLQQQVVKDITELKSLVANIAISLDGIKKSIDTYCDFAQKTFATKEEVEILKADGKYARLWSGVLGGGIGVIITAIITAILWQDNNLIALIIQTIS